MNTEQKTLTQTNCKNRILFIYEHLIRLGYPKITQTGLSETQQIQKYLSAYFQSTSHRLQLIEWLLAVAYPSYREQKWFMIQKDHVNRLIKSLWKIGVMPVSKYTKNLDYRKYLQGMLGYENAIILIYNMSELAFESVLLKKSRPDVNFGLFYHELIESFNDLVNQQYDIYGIMFPCKFINVQQHENVGEDDKSEQFMSQFQRQYQEFYKQKMSNLLQRQDEILDKIYKANNSNKQTDSEDNHLTRYTQSLNKFGKQFHEKYACLVMKIENLLQNQNTKNKLIPFLSNGQRRKQDGSIQQTINKRSVRITKQFCEKYKKYKKVLRGIRISKDDKKFMETRTILLQNIMKINESLNI